MDCCEPHKAECLPKNVPVAALKENGQRGGREMNRIRDDHKIELQNGFWCGVMPLFCLSLCLSVCYAVNCCGAAGQEAELWKVVSVANAIWGKDLDLRKCDFSVVWRMMLEFPVIVGLVVKVV